jgi:hypothetical protein
MSEPPNVRRSDPWTSHAAKARIQPTRESKRGRCLTLLQQHAGEWVAGHVFTAPDVGGSEGLRRLRELRQMGWAVERKPKPGNVTEWLYRLPDTPLEPMPFIPTPPAFTEGLF